MPTRRAILSYLFLLFPVLVFSSCVATQQDISALKRQIQIMNNQIYKLGKVRETQADESAEIESMKIELQRLLGLLEENRHMMEKTVGIRPLDQDALTARLAALEERVEQVFRHLNLEARSEFQSQASLETPITVDGPKPSPHSAGEEALDSSEKTIYEETLAIYHEGRYDEAVLGFKNLIQKHPQSNLADNAQFWIGECYMAMKKYGQAIKAFRQVEEKYPQGNKVPNAMLKQALAFVELEDETAAKYLLNKLVKNYPNSEESKIAAAKLKVLN